jgi:hypothetical protein
MPGKPDNEVKAMEAAFGMLSGLKPEEKKRVLLWLWQKLEVSDPPPANAWAAGTAAAGGQARTGSVLNLPSGNGAATTPKNFLAQKDPKTDAQRITCLAYYLTHQRGTTQFKTKELTTLNTEAAQPPFSNPGVAVSNAAANKYLSPAGGGKKQITVNGERLVEALPDQGKVKALPAARKRKSSKKKGGKA